MLTDNQLINSPARSYNVDKTGIALDGHAPKLLLNEVKKVIHRTKNQITVITCVSASGQYISLFVIFAAKRLNMECMEKWSSCWYCIWIEH